MKRASILPLVLLLAACQTSFPRDQHWVRSDLYFGMTRRDASEITDSAFQHFVDNQITPAFPEGFTLTSAAGQYLDANKKLHRESSHVLTILYRRDAAPDADRKLRALSAEYCRQFDQESVLRIDATARAEFLSAPVVKQNP